MKRKLFNKKKLLSIIIAFVVATTSISLIITKSINKKDENIITSNEEDIQYSYSKVYLADNSNTLLPLTIKYEKFDSIGEELIHVINMLKVDSKISNETFNGLLPKDTFVTSLSLENNILDISFDENFKNYDGKNEVKLLESLVWTLTDFDEVDYLNLFIKDERIENMPVNNTPVRKNMNKEIGINKYLLTTSMMFSNEMILSYYEKEIDGKYYYVPVTHYVTNEDNLNLFDLTVSNMFVSPGITSSLQVCRALNNVSIVSNCIFKEDTLYLSLSEDILFDETTVSLDIYNIFKEVTCLLKGVEDVSFLMDLEEVMVNGKENDESKVSKVILNKFYI